jgi:hypothetical protein
MREVSKKKSGESHGIRLYLYVLSVQRRWTLSKESKVVVNIGE